MCLIAAFVPHRSNKLFPPDGVQQSYFDLALYIMTASPIELARVFETALPRTSGRLTAKSISIKDAKCRSGDGARKATELTPGDLLGVASATESAVRRSDRRAEVSRGRIRSCRRRG